MMAGKMWHDVVYKLGDSKPADLEGLDVEVSGICGDTEHVMYGQHPK